MKLRIHIIDFLLNLYHNKGILAMFTFTINIKPYPIVGVSNMLLTTNQTSLLVYEALASDIRLKIIDRLFEKEMNIKELAAELYLSNAIVSSHVAKLEKAGIVGSKMKRINGGTYKMCYINTEHMQIKLSLFSINVAMRKCQYRLDNIRITRHSQPVVSQQPRR